jgi:Zn-dependent peptidase ImmA (M78 family)
MNRTAIDRRAQQLLAAANITGPAVNVKAVAAHLGLVVTLDDLGDDCSGVLVRSANGAVIGVNKDHHENRQRFTIAHEIAHFCLHTGKLYVDKGYWINFRNADSGSGTKEEERQANAFAAALLMPAAWVKERFYAAPFDLGDDSNERLEALADQFGVSQQAMTYRLMSLGLVEGE